MHAEACAPRISPLGLGGGATGALSWLPITLLLAAGTLLVAGAAMRVRGNERWFQDAMAGIERSIETLKSQGAP